MANVIIFIPIVLSLLVLGAHFLRFGNMIGVTGAIVLVALLFLRKPWVARLLQLVLVFAALEWVRTLVGLVQIRVGFDQPYTRMAIILGSVAAVAVISALLFETRTMKQIYRRSPIQD